MKNKGFATLTFIIVMTALTSFFIARDAFDVAMLQHKVDALKIHFTMSYNNYSCSQIQTLFLSQFSEITIDAVKCDK